MNPFIKKICFVFALFFFSIPAHAEGSFWDDAKEKLAQAAEAAAETLNAVQKQIQNDINGCNDGSTPAPVTTAVAIPVGGSSVSSSSPTPAPTPTKTPVTPVSHTRPTDCGKWGYEANEIVIDVFLLSSYSEKEEASRMECLTWALDNGADVNGKDPVLHPLILAIENGYPEMAKLLIQRGANPNTVDEHGISALGQAAFEMEDDVIEVLLAKNADPNLGDENHAAPLLFAVNKADLAVTRSLLAHGAKPSPIFNLGSENETPLDASASQMIVLGDLMKQYANNPDADKSTSEYLIDRTRSDYSPSRKMDRPAPARRTIEQIYSDAKEVNALLKASNAVCATTPCGGVIGASAAHDQEQSNSIKNQLPSDNQQSTQN